MESDIRREIQNRLLNRTLLVLGIFVVPTLFVSLWLYFDMGWQPAFTANLVLAAAIICFSVLRKSISYKIKTYFLVMVFFIVAISSAINFGLSGFLLEFLMLAVFVAVVFWGTKGAFRIYVCSAATIMIIALLHITGVLPLMPETDIDTKKLTTWLAVLTTFIFITGLVIIIAGEIGHLLYQKLKELQEKNQALASARSEISKLRGILPICSNCKKIRDDEGYWNQVESYIESHSEAKFTHSLCGECLKELYGSEDWFDKKK